MAAVSASQLAIFEVVQGFDLLATRALLHSARMKAVDRILDRCD